MRKNIIIYFILFGFLFGYINTIDRTGGELPYSMLLNYPALVAIGLKDNLFNSIERARVNKLGEEFGVSSLPPSDEFNKLSPEKQKEFVSKMTRQKSSARNDWLIGEKGRLGIIRGFISLPILSAFAWGLIGVIIYMMELVKKKFSNTGV